MNQSSRIQDKLPPARRRLFIVVSMLIPLLIMAVIEVLLRLSGFGGYEPLMKEMEDTSQGRLVVSQQAGTRDFFFANLARPGFSGQYAFHSPKAANTVRIVLVGGSAIKGFPQTRRFAASAFLKEMLGDVWPHRTVEVINLGTTAVASFPVREFLKQALAYEPDLVVVYSGHNEFYGAYGVVSSNQAGSSPAMLKLQHQLHGLAIVQATGRLLQYLRGWEPPSLMEAMVGQDFISAESWKREAAANLLYRHIGSMVRMGQESSVPVLVCTLAGNEKDLAPIGSGQTASDAERLVDAAINRHRAEPEKLKGVLLALLERQPANAKAHYHLGRVYDRTGDHEKAQHHYVQARDLDTMPWRATSALQQSIRRAAREHGATLCDVEQAFRSQSPGGSIGWELMDDHVHPSLQGQALRIALGLEEQMTPEIRAIAWQWQKEESHREERRPISGMVAHGLLREERYREAMALFDVARNSVPVYSAQYLGYVYNWLAIRHRLHDGLSAADLALLDREIERGELLLRRGPTVSESIVEYLTGLRKLRGEQS